MTNDRQGYHKNPSTRSSRHEDPRNLDNRHTQYDRRGDRRSSYYDRPRDYYRPYGQYDLRDDRRRSYYDDPREDDSRDRYYPDRNFSPEHQRDSPEKTKKPFRVHSNEGSCLYSEQLHNLFNKDPHPTVVTLAISIFESAVKANECNVFVLQSTMRIISEQSNRKTNAIENLEHAQKIWHFAQEKNVVNYRIVSSYIEFLLRAEKYDDLILVYNDFEWPEEANPFESQKYADNVYLKTYNISAFNYMSALKETNDIEKAKTYYNNMIKNPKLNSETKSKLSQLYFQMCFSAQKHEELDAAFKKARDANCVGDSLFRDYIKLRYTSSPNKVIDDVQTAFWSTIKSFLRDTMASRINRDLKSAVEIMVKWIVDSDVNNLYLFWRQCITFKTGIIYEFFILMMTELMIQNTLESYEMAKKIFKENTCNLYSQHLGIFHTLMQQAILKNDIEFGRKIYLKIMTPNPFEKKPLSDQVSKIQNLFLYQAVSSDNVRFAENNPDEIFRSITKKTALGYASYMWYLLQQKRYADVRRIFSEAKKMNGVSSDGYTCYLLCLLRTEFVSGNDMEIEEGECTVQRHIFAESFKEIEKNNGMNEDHIKLLLLAARKEDFNYVKEKIFFAKEKGLFTKDIENLYQIYTEKKYIDAGVLENTLLTLSAFKHEFIKSEIEAYIRKYTPSTTPSNFKPETKTTLTSSSTSSTTSTSQQPIASDEPEERKITDLESKKSSEKKRKNPTRKKRLGKINSKPLRKKRKKSHPLTETTPENADLTPECSSMPETLTDKVTNDSPSRLPNSDDLPDSLTEFLMQDLPDSFEFIENIQKPVGPSSSSLANPTASKIFTAPSSQFFTRAPLSPANHYSNESDDEEENDHPSEELSGEVSNEDGPQELEELRVSIKEIHVFLQENKDNNWTDATMALEFFKAYHLRGSSVPEWERYYKKAGLEAMRDYIIQFNTDVIGEEKKISLFSLKSMTPEELKEKTGQYYDQKRLLYHKNQENEDYVIKDEIEQIKVETSKKTTSEDRKRKKF